MNLGIQFCALLRMNLAGIPARLGLVLTIVIGVASAVGVLIAMLAMGVGAQREAMGNVRPDRVILRSLDAENAVSSTLPKDQAVLLRELPGIQRNARGEPIAVPESLVIIVARNKTDGSSISFPIVGAGPGLTDYLPELHLTQGRMFKPGLRELIASHKCVQQLEGFAAGDTRTMRGGDWPIVGNFQVGQTEGSCMVFGDADTIMSAFGRTAYNEMDVMLQSPAAFDALVQALKANPTLRFEAKPEAKIAAEDNADLNGILDFVSYFVGGIMAVAATIGAANSLYAIVDSRRRELATLRALGFNPLLIIASILSESILLALPGALAGSLVAWLLVDNLAASPFGSSFHLVVTLPLVALGLTWAFTMGLLSGLLPAIRAARMPVSAALRAT
jgi:putative ABC transport system permease protein